MTAKYLETWVNGEYVFSAPELAGRWGVNRKTVNKMLNNGRLNGIKVGQGKTQPNWGVLESEVIRAEQDRLVMRRNIIRRWSAEAQAIA